VLLVVAYHSGVVPVDGGYIGVDVFFVISGFLITGQILKQLHSGGFGFADFYARRARRILPASLAVAAVTLLGAMLFMPPVLRAGASWDALWTALYVPNIALAVRGTDYLAETSPSPFQHYWSLGVEEQFYLVLPLILVVLWAVSRRRSRVVGVVIAVLVAASFGYGWWLTYQSPPWAYFGIAARAWELGAGSLLAIAGSRLAGRIPGAARALIGWAGLAMIVGAALVYDERTAFPGIAAAVPVLGSAAVIFAGQADVRFGPGVVLARRPMVFIGAISYSWYLVHWPILVVPLSGGELGIWPRIGLVVLGLVIAVAMHYAIENPIRNLKWLSTARPRRSLWAALACSILVVMIAGATLPYAVASVPSATRPAPIVQIAPDPGAEMSGDRVVPTFTEFVPRDLRPSLADVAADAPRIYADGCHASVEDVTVQQCHYGDVDADLRVAIFGDSHAAQWFPALELLSSRASFAIDSYTKSSCPSADVDVLTDGVPYTQCTTWRRAVIDEIRRSAPDLVIISNMSDQPGQADGGIPISTWSAGLGEVIDALALPVLVIADTPRFEATPAICLSMHIDDTRPCDVPRANAVSDDWVAAEKSTALQHGAQFLDLTNYLCDEARCGTIIGDILLFRDAHHLTTDAARSLAGPIWRVMRPMLDDAGGPSR